jgi:mRNA-degrading endonuclease RelE of RelBE toxin-antitoxin system
VARKRGFLNVRWSTRWEKGYLALSGDRRKAAGKTAMALIKQEFTPGMRVKPIEPEKYYNEARINDGDRLVFRIDHETVWFVDVIVHDHISRYGKKLEGLFPG